MMNGAGEAKHRKRILIVEDEQEAAIVLADVLTALGYEPRMAHSAAAAKHCLEHFDATVALVDLRLGDADGLDLIAELKPRYPRMEFIVVTGRMDRESAVSALRSGVYDYLIKPVELTELHSILTRCFDKHRLTSSNADALEALAAAREATTNFLANMSHELRTPLNAIIGFSNLLHARLPLLIDDQRLIDYTADIEASGQVLLAIVNGILDFVQTEADTFTLRRQPTSITALLHESAALIEPTAAQASLVLEFALPDDLPVLNVDPFRIKQAMLNLLQNAVKFTPQGGEIHLSAAAMQDGGITIIVRDNGIGMTAEEIRHAVMPFTQIGNAETRNFEGVGLGLPMAVRLTEAHGGTLHIDSKPGAGTVATLRLPSEPTLDSAVHRL